MTAAAAASQLYSLGAPVVRIGMPSSDAEELSGLLLCWEQDVCLQIHRQLWLLVVLNEQRRRVPHAERPSYDEQANRILEMLDPEPPAAAFAVGGRVTHRDLSGSDGSTLPMAGTLVGVEVRYVVQWDDAEPRPVSGWTPTYSYPAAFLAALPR